MTQPILQNYLSKNKSSNFSAFNLFRLRFSNIFDSQTTKLKYNVHKIFSENKFWHRSVVAKTLFVTVMFCVIPFIIYSVLSNADQKRSDLLRQAGVRQGKILSHALIPYFEKGISELSNINDVLDRFSGDGLDIRILFQPNKAKSKDFYYVTALPAVAPDFMRSERQYLEKIGVLQRIGDSCEQRRASALRHKFNNREYLISSIVPVLTASGCWVIISSDTHKQILDSSLGKPYWKNSEVQIAALLYFCVAFTAVLFLLRVRKRLLRFRKLALAIGPHSGNLSIIDQNIMPELDDVVVEFDRIVDRLEMLSVAIEKSPVGIAVAAPDWILVYVNPAFNRLTKYTEDDALRQTPKSLLSVKNTKARWDEVCRCVEGGDTWHGDIEVQRADGTVYWADMSVYPLGDTSSRARRFVLVQQDVSERLTLLAKLDAARWQAEDANRAKSAFLAQMSHELRTPLNAILGFSEILSDQSMPDSMKERRFEYARHIHDSGKHLLSVINDLLDLSKLEAGKTELHFEPVYLQALINSTVPLIAPQAVSAGVKINWDPERAPEIKYNLDVRAIRQILLNLLSNAIKYTPPNGFVTVNISRNEDDAMILTISDSGCGIEEEDIPKITEPYTQVQELARTREGTGLGLPIVKELIKLHGADMQIESKIDVGTTVRLIFPRSMSVSPIDALTSARSRVQ